VTRRTPAGLLGPLILIALLLPAQTTPRFDYIVVKEHPHNPQSFTQGLEFAGGELYESTGLVGQSGIFRIRLEDGKALEKLPLEQPYFGEGITLLGNRVFQITWQNQTGFIYQRSPLRRLRSFQYTGEGWGLTNDGKQLYMSDGTAQIRVIDPNTMREVRRINVNDAGRPLKNLNELEWWKGELLANVWMTDYVVRISPVDGRVTGWIDFSGLLKNSSGADVLNGIAWNQKTDRLYVTGKLWPRIFEVKIVPRLRR
jgi:glutaminyl-peptide cyclotransferase